MKEFEPDTNLILAKVKEESKNKELTFEDVMKIYLDEYYKQEFEFNFGNMAISKWESSKSGSSKSFTESLFKINDIALFNVEKEKGV